MNTTESQKVVGMLLAAFPAARITEPTVRLYERMLGDLDFELATNAVTRLVCTSKFMPTIAEIREAAADLSVGPARSGLEAWGDVMLAIRRVGHYGVPKFEDPLVAECVRIMGWRYLCIGDVPEGVDRSRVGGAAVYYPGVNSMFDEDVRGKDFRDEDPVVFTRDAGAIRIKLTDGEQPSEIVIPIPALALRRSEVSPEWLALHDSEEQANGS